MVIIVKGGDGNRGAAYCNEFTLWMAVPRNFNSYKLYNNLKLAISTRQVAIST